jgi:hypothetical protein
VLAKVVVDYNHSTEFFKYHTHSWLKVEAGNPLWPDRIKAAVDSQLVAKGWQQVPSGGDASISAFGATLEQPKLKTFYTGFGGGWRWRGFGDGMAITTVDKAVFPVAMIVATLFGLAFSGLRQPRVAHQGPLTKRARLNRECEKPRTEPHCVASPERVPKMLLLQCRAN